MDEQNVVYRYNRILFGHKRNEVLNHAITWMNLENIMLSKITQTQKNKQLILFGWFHLHKISRKRQIDSEDDPGPRKKIGGKDMEDARNV